MTPPPSPASPPVGAEVDPTPALRPTPTTLVGRHVTLAPLDPAAHADALYAASHGPEREAIWAYLGPAPFPDRNTYRTYLEGCAVSTDPVFQAILSSDDGRPLGYAAYMRIEPVHRVIEIGNILYTPTLQRTAGATEAMYLMARHAFETLGYRRYEWKCNALNAPSRSAALRFGFTYEGLFRQHMVIKGRTRDTTWFSMLDHEWPARRAAFEAWLAPENFDADGRQKRRLESFR